MSWIAEVQTSGDPKDKWSSNYLTFDTKEEAEGYVHDLMMRWMAVTETRVREVIDKPTTHVWLKGERRLVNLKDKTSHVPPVSINIDDQD